MRQIRRRQRIALNLPSLRLEGSLFLPDQLENAARGHADRQKEADYQTPKGLKLRDDYSRAFQIASAQWKAFEPLLDRKDVDADIATRTFVHELLRDAFGYHGLVRVEGQTLGDRHYPITLLAGNTVPVVVAPHTLGLDDLDPLFAIAGSGSRRKSAFQLAQEFLNASGDHLWAIVSNGRQLRLLRDAATLTRPSFLEVDLQDLLGGQRFAEFAMAWRLLHASRAGLEGKTPEACIWEAWRSAGQEEGTRVREGLRVGVTQALLALGSGFLQHPANEILRIDLLEGRLPRHEYFQQLLRLVYRLIFLFTVEERGLLHPRDDSPAGVSARAAYAEGYALGRLREQSLRRRARTRFDDLWAGVRIVFRGLAGGEPRLALPALGGLFAPTQCPALDAASLTNASLLEAIRHLRWADASGTLAPVDYRNMGPEELGSVYESLLELEPEVDIPARAFGFIGLESGGVQGNARKTSGSYYTPDSLVQELIRSALDPLIEQRIAENPANPTGALLDIKVIDPACGSGHFLLAAARRLAERLAALRSTEGAIKPQDYRHALREVIGRCIFGVDRNPLALELCRTALWLEGFEEGRPLSFLDHHLQCGDALLGLMDLKTLEKGIPAAAFKPLSGDDKEVCKQLTRENRDGLKALEKHGRGRQASLVLEQAAGLSDLQALEALPADTPADIAAREAAYEAFLAHARESELAHAADLLLGAFLLAKTETNAPEIPTSTTLYFELFSDRKGLTGERAVQHQRQLAAARRVCEEARVLHWPLTFPQVFKRGGFDCVLGNPPWERIKLQEEEFFATRNPLVAEAKNKAERSQRIDWLAQGLLARHLYPELDHGGLVSTAEQRLYQEFLVARRTAEAASVFVHLKAEEGGRFPLTGVGDVNTYALFAETNLELTAGDGRAGFIVPTGIATDDSTKAYFGHITQTGRLVSLFDFENREGLFPAVDSRMKFCLLTLGPAAEAEFAFFLTQTAQLADERRRFSLNADDFVRINPNTLTCPVFRSRMDAELTRKIYRYVPVLHRHETSATQGWNPWHFDYMTKMFDMADNSDEFLDSAEFSMLGDAQRYAPLYEAKHVHLFDHRWASQQNGQLGPVPLDQKVDPMFFISTRYRISGERVDARLATKAWARGWLLGWRDITNATNERTVIAAIFPRVGVAHTLRVAFVKDDAISTSGFVACLSSIALDYVARQKVGGTHLTVESLKQLPILPPERFSEYDLGFVVPRVLELTYTSWDLRPWALDLGFSGDPFIFNPERRAVLRAELDAWYARAYGLTRDELRYILDPADVMGPDYPSETFRVLKNNELREFGEYRTQRLVLEAWDRLPGGEGTRVPVPLQGEA